MKRLVPSSTTTQRPVRNRRGVVLVEFAVVAPLFFLILFTMIEFSHLVTIRNAAHNAAYEAARLVVVPGAVASEGETEARRILGICGIQNLDVQVTPTNIDPDTPEVTVDVQIPYAANALFIPRFAGNIIVRSQVVLRTERYENW